MSLHEPRRQTPNRYVKVVLGRLHREAVAYGSGTRSFGQICDVTSIPRDLRPGLLRTLLDHGYVMQERDDQVRLTVAGALVATAVN